MTPNGKVDPNRSAWDAYVWVGNATIARDICEQPYGNRDFDVLHCNGYRLCFGHGIE